MLDRKCSHGLPMGHGTRCIECEIVFYEEGERNALARAEHCQAMLEQLRRERVIESMVDEVKAAPPEQLRPKRPLREFLDEIKPK